jgi:hypothetical protein
MVEAVYWHTAGCSHLKGSHRRAVAGRTVAPVRNLAVREGHKMLPVQSRIDRTDSAGWEADRTLAPAGLAAEIGIAVCWAAVLPGRSLSTLGNCLAALAPSSLHFDQSWSSRSSGRPALQRQHFRLSFLDTLQSTCWSPTWFW